MHSGNPTFPHSDLQPLHRRNFVPISLHKMINDVKLFHQTFGHPIQPVPTIPSPERQVLRNKLIRDEYIQELVPAWNACADTRKKIDTHPADSAIDIAALQHENVVANLAEFGDAIADVIYFLIGTALEYGLPLDQIWDAVQQANMSKLWTKEEYDDREDEDWQSELVTFVAKTGTARCYTVTDMSGKVRKPPSWKEPNIVEIVRNAMKGPTDAR